MRIPKRMLIILLSGLLLSILVACGSKEEPVATPVPEEAPSAEEAEQAADAALAAARVALAEYLTIPVDNLELGTIEEAEWPDACLGLAYPDEMCAQMITNGYLINFSYQGESYAVRTDLSGDTVRVEAAAEANVPAEPEEIPAISQPIYRWGEVADRVWVLVGYGDALNPTVVEEGTVVTAIFSGLELKVSGSGGCNNYFADYEFSDDGMLTISGPIGATMMFCEEGNEQEAAYFAALETVSAWNLTEEGRLELSYGSGEPFAEKLVYAPGETPLAGTTWNLVSYGDPDGPQTVLPGTSITLVLSAETDDSGNAGGNATCNGYSTGYTLDGDQIGFGPIAGTLMMCPVGAEQEAAYLAALETAASYQIAGPNLQITYDGGVLNFTSLNLPLENVLWQALMVTGEPVPADVEITALFTPGEEAGMGSVGGNAGCNSYNAGYTSSIDASSDPASHVLAIEGPIATTLAVCPEEALAELEQSYLAALETAESYEILGDQLVVKTAEGDIQYAADRQPLQGTLWLLTSLGDVNEPQPPVEGSNFTAQFSRLPSLPSGTVVGGTGCNDYNATFTANLTEIKINLPAKTNNEECPWGEGNFEVEQQFFLALNNASEYRILGNVLQILYGEGQQVLNFVATQPAGEEIVDLSPLADTFWYLLSIGDNALLPYTEITAGFEIAEDGRTGTISGSGGCNGYNAAIGENFVVGAVASTRRACETEVMEQEGGYFDWLSKAYSYTRAGDQLLISTANGILTFNSQPVLDQSQELQGVTWYLVSAGTQTAIEGSNATSVFSSGDLTVSGTTGCNEFNGSYRTEPGNQLTISGFSSTQAACATEDLARQEEAMLIFLQSATGYTIRGDALQIQTVDGSVMNYTSIPPAQPAAPTAVISGPTQVDRGQVLTLDGSGSSAGSTAIVRYDWNMGDGTVLSGPSVQYAYSEARDYTVSLTVTDRAGLVGNATQSVQVRPVVDVQPPSAVIEGPAMAFVGETVTFSAANSGPGTGAITSYQWQSGDGNNTGPEGEDSFTTIYAMPGTYYPTVTVADANGLSDSATMAVLINAHLEGTEWILQKAIPGTSISLQFANGNVTGFSGCNNYNASYATTRAAGPENEISIGNLSSTGSICSPQIMNQEQGYLASLQTASSYAIEGGKLSLVTGQGTLVFTAAIVTTAAVP